MPILPLNLLFPCLHLSSFRHSSLGSGFLLRWDSGSFSRSNACLGAWSMLRGNFHFVLLQSSNWRVCSCSESGQLLTCFKFWVICFLFAALALEKGKAGLPSRLVSSYVEQQEPHGEICMPVGINRLLTTCASFLEYYSGAEQFLKFSLCIFFFPLVSGYQMLEVQLVLRQALQNVWTQSVGIKKVRWKCVWTFWKDRFYPD